MLKYGKEVYKFFFTYLARISKANRATGRSSSTHVPIGLLIYNIMEIIN